MGILTVHEKIFRTVVQPVLDQTFKDLGNGMGAKVGEMLAEFKVAFDGKIQRECEAELATLKENLTHQISQSEEPTASPQEATGSRANSTSKNKARSDRRRRCKIKLSVGRESLLQLRSTSELLGEASSDMNPSTLK
jgi:hypothetical protein